MPSWRSSRIINFFMLTLENDKSDFHWEEILSPEEFVCAIINYIEEKIALHFPFCFSVK